MNIFAWNYQGAPFVPFGTEHIAALLVILGICTILFLFRKCFSDRAKTILRYFFAILLLGNEAAWHIWNLAMGTWTLQTMLPLHICSIMVYTGAYTLFTRSARFYELLYFMGIGAASQALITPDLGIFGFPHFRFLQTFISHGTMLIIAIYMTAVEGFRPKPISILRVIVGMNLYMGFVAIINLLVGSNYLFIMHKPETPSLIDMLGPWPWYILSMEGIGIAICLVLYAPFFIQDHWVSKKKPSIA